MLSPEPLIGSQSATNTKLLSEFNTKCIGSKGGGTHKGYLRGADSCRKTNTLSQQLDKGQSRPLDPVHGTGIHAGAAGQPCPVSSSYGGNTLFGRAETHPRRDTKNASERGYHTVNPSRRSAGLLLKHLSSSEEGWRYETSDKPEASQRVHYPTPFQNGGIHTLKDLLKRNDWMTKVDLKDAYFTIPIHTSNRPFLRFSALGSQYQFTCLPFGLSSAPWVFTKTLKPVTTLLRELGVRLVIYIDDILVIAESPECAKEHTKGLIYLLENLGFTVHPEKTQLTPTQTIEFLGMEIDSRSLELRVPGRKLKKSDRRQPRYTTRSLLPQREKCHAY